MNFTDQLLSGAPRPGPSGTVGRPVAFAGCAGLYHPAPGATAVLMVGTWGYEAFCQAKARRILAERLAAAGYPVLRYDHPGTGDSLDDGATDLSGWTAALAAARARLEELSGAERIVVVAEGVGAALVLAGLDPDAPWLAGVAALAPVVSGRTHLREIQALGAMVGGTLPDAVAVAGFRLPPGVAADLGRIDLRSAEFHVPAAFVAARPGRNTEEALAGRLHTPDGPAELVAYADYEASVGDPTRAEPPRATHDALLAWLAAAVPAGHARPRPVAAAPASDDLAGPGYVEVGVRFAEAGRLYGVLTCPASRAAHTAVVIANAGRDPHVGWARFGVDLARGLAAHGVAALRIDLSAVGEGLPPAGAEDAELLYSTVHQDDVVAAADFLVGEGFGDLVLTGRCSGAYAVLHAAPRIAAARAVVPVNILRLVWDPAESVAAAIAGDVRPIGAVAKQALDPRIVLRIAKGEVDPRNLLRRLAGRLAARLPAARAAERGRRRAARDLVAGLAARGTAVAFVSGETDGGLGQIEDAFGPGGADLAAFPGASLRLVADTDHNLTPPAAREAVAGILAAIANAT